MKIAILYICTGKYVQFFKDFYESTERYFFAGKAQKEYFVWTDDTHLTTDNNVHLIEKRCEGFPKDSLFRFEMFLQVKEEILKCDYVYFFNSNALFVKPVGEEVLPDKTGLVATLWGKRNEKPAFLFPYERNRKSKAYIPPHKGPYHYVAGNFNGGNVLEYMKLATILAQDTRDDYSRGIVACVHDESHLNKYMHEHGCKILDARFCWPEEWKLNEETTIMLRNKTRLDNYFNKGRDLSVQGKIKKAFRIMWSVVRWYLYF